MRNLKEWVDKSFKVPGASENAWLTMDFQTLGRLDVKIQTLWNDLKNKKDDLKTPEELMVTQDVFMYSRLWVLAGYELVRLLKVMNPEKYAKVYKKFKLVRIPLAKYQKANDKSGNINPAILGLSTSNNEIGWEIEEGKFITRDELASNLLNTI